MPHGIPLGDVDAVTCHLPTSREHPFLTWTLSSGPLRTFVGSASLARYDDTVEQRSNRAALGRGGNRQQSGPLRVNADRTEDRVGYSINRGS